MRVFLDNSPLPVDRPTLAAAIHAGCAAAQTTGRVIVEATRDGQPIASDDLANPSDADLGAATIRLVSAEPRSLVGTTLRQVADLLEATRRQQQGAARALLDDRADEALRAMADVLVAWDQARRALEDGARLLGLDLASARPGPPAPDGSPLTVADRARTLGAHLAEVKRAIQARDWHGLADSLAYDLDSDAEAWRLVLDDIAAAALEERA